MGSSVEELLARIKARKAASQMTGISPSGTDIENVIIAHNATKKVDVETANPDAITEDKDGNVIQYNAKQLEAVNYGKNNQSFIVIGAAGTGKTTVMKGVTKAIIESGRSGVIRGSHKTLQNGSPGIVICAFTRRAVANIRRNLSDDLKGNCLTIHALLEYEPVWRTIVDNTSGEERNTMAFEPTRNAYNLLDASIHTYIFEEASMISVDLFQQVIEAIGGRNVQFIFLGDIQQLPPVFGSAILGFKMLELPTVELTEVYRQALESPILRLAHRILSGNPIPQEEYPEWNFKDQLKLHPWKKKIDSEDACRTAALFFINAMNAGQYNPKTDAILIPFNKAFGSIELNKIIANKITHGKIPTYEIIAGFNTHYLAVGDKVLVNKEDAIITNISLNGKYVGKQPQLHDINLDRWGHCTTGSHEVILSDDAIDNMLDAMAKGIASADEDRVHAASHIIDIEFLDGSTSTLESAAAINELLLGYALTVHKSQGSEWDKVFLLLHQSHATMLQRELLYTAVTRAKKELYVICEPESFTKGIKSQRIKGNTLKEKAEFFNGKLERGEYTLEN